MSIYADPSGLFFVYTADGRERRLSAGELREFFHLPTRQVYDMFGQVTS